MTALMRPLRPGPVALGLLVLAALCVGIAGFDHARLYHRGYAEVEWVGALFLLNGIATAAVILLLVFDRPWLFVLGTLGLSVGSLIGILLSHSDTGFLGFREGGYDSAAKLIVWTEVAATVFALLGAVVLRRQHATRTATAPVASSVAA